MPYLLISEQVEKNGKDKRSSLLSRIVNGKIKRFYNNDTSAFITKLFTDASKPEHFSASVTSNLVLVLTGLLSKGRLLASPVS